MRIAVVAAGILLVVLHFVLRVGLGLQAGVPDLATLGLLVAARDLRMGAGAGFGFALGLLEDSLSTVAFGASTMALTAVGAAAARTRDLFVGDSVLFVGAYLFLGKWCRDLIRWIMTSSEFREPFDRALLVDSTVASLYLTVVGLVLVRIFGNWLESTPRTGGGSP